MKTINHFLFNIILFLSVFFTVFSYVLTSSSHAADITALNTFLRAATLIGSEYLVSRNGKSLNNTASENINDGELGSITVKPDYSSVIVDALGGQGPNLNDLNSIATDFDVSHMSQEELTKFNALLLGDDHLSGENILYKTCTVNGVTAYWAVNQAGQWIGDSIENIAVKFIPKTQTLTNNINNVLNTDYDYKNLVYTKNLQVNQTSTVWILDCDANVYFYTDSGYLYVVLPYGAYQNDYFSDIRIISQGNVVYTGRATMMGDNSTKFTINNVQYQYGWVSANSNTVNSQNAFSSLDAIKAQIAAHGYLGDVVYADIIDLNTDLGYQVQDTLDNVVPISDIYYAIQALEEAINGLRTDQQGFTDGLTIGLDSTLLATIQQAITDAITKGLAITDENSGGNGGNGNEEEENYSTEIPVAYWPSFFPDLLPQDMFSMFQPIFDIVGSSYSMYSLWIIIPSILIFILILYIIISIF